MATKPETEGGATNPAATKPDTEESTTASTTDSKPDTEGNTTAATTDSQPAAHDMKQRKGQFIITPRHHPGMQMMGIAPLSMSVVEQALKESPDIEIIDRIGPKQVVGALGTGLAEGGALVARMQEEKAQALALQAQGQLIVERDQPLQLFDADYPQPAMVSYNMPLGGSAFSAEFQLSGRGQAVEGAEVYLFGSLLPARGVSDANGRVRLTLQGDSAASVRRLYVKPRADFWSFWQERPDICTDQLNTISLRALSDWPGLNNFPQQQQLTWGQRAMRLDQLPNTYRGQGVKIAVVDSGCANSHQDLTQVTHGRDIVNKDSGGNTWNIDTIAHGSHCTGVIAGLDSSTGIRGFAPDAEIHACKLFPGGQVSQLIEALEYCIEHQIDVVNLSLGGAEPSEALEQQIIRARRAGVACIVAAGNSGGPVQYPGSSPNVLTVAAIGRVNEFPSDSYHMQTLTPQVDVNGFFAARFSCYGPEIAVCAPGVAITSSVPDNNFAAWDGTSMAAPHVTGLAALVLAHHPDFRGSGQMRSAERVERLFQIIKRSCQPLMLGDPRRTGFGLPDVVRAVGLGQAQGVMPGASAIGSLMHAGSQLGALGSLGSNPLASMMSANTLQAMANAYREPPALSPQHAALGIALGLGVLDPYAAYRGAITPAYVPGYW